MEEIKINTIIFSFDRAMQLELLLESIVQYDRDRILKIHVVFCCSSKIYKKAYWQLQECYPHFEWIEETVYNKPKWNFDFSFSYWHNIYWWLKNNRLKQKRSDFKQVVMQILSHCDEKFVMFLTDDSLFYRELHIPPQLLKKLLTQAVTCSFSLRHGIHLESEDCVQLNEAIEWNVYRNDFSTDWGYPFSVDGHIYNKKTIQKIARRIVFNNPNTLEGNIACYVRERKLFSQVFAMKSSCLVGFELNRVQTVVDNHHKGISQEKLNKYFLDGYRLWIMFDKTDIKHFRPENYRLIVQKKDEKIEIFNNIDGK
jgi:hypothetical protein